MLRIEEEICAWHPNQFKGSVFVSKKYVSMKSQTPRLWVSGFGGTGHLLAETNLSGRIIKHA